MIAAEREKRIKDALKAEEENDEHFWWLSFADGTKPKGTQNLGVVITKAKGMAHAIAKSHELGLNPGGGIQACTFSHKLIEGKDCCDKLLTRDDLRRLDLIA